MSTLSSKFLCIKIERCGHIEHVWAIKYNHLSKLDWLADWKSRVLRALDKLFSHNWKKKGEMGMDSPMQDFAKVSSPKLLIWAILVARIFYRANTKKNTLYWSLSMVTTLLESVLKPGSITHAISSLHFNISRCSEKYYINYLNQYIPVVE